MYVFPVGVRDKKFRIFFFKKKKLKSPLCAELLKHFKKKNLIKK